MKRFQVYKKRRKGGYFHLFSELAESRISLIEKMKKDKNFVGNLDRYYITGLLKSEKCTGI